MSDAGKGHGANAGCMYRAHFISDHPSPLTQAEASSSPRITAVHPLDRTMIGFDEQQGQALITVSCAALSVMT